VLHPEAKEYARKSYGGKKRHGLAGETVSQADSFAADTAAKTGLTPRTIQQDVRNPCVKQRRPRECGSGIHRGSRMAGKLAGR